MLHSKNWKYSLRMYGGSAPDSNFVIALNEELVRLEGSDMPASIPEANGINLVLI